MKRVSIIGGGTVGWLTATFLRKKHPDYDITLIESSSIGVIGAGETTVSRFAYFLQNMDVDVFDFMKKTGATFKLGTKFTNWQSKGNSYFATINPYCLSMTPQVYSNNENIEDLVYQYCLQNNISLNDFSVNRLNTKNFSPFYKKNGKTHQYQVYTLHIDGVKTGQYLKEFCKDKNIKVIDNKVNHFINNEDEEITKIVFVDGTDLNTDFVFDCSGFTRLVLEKHYNLEWKSLKDLISIKATIPFFLPQENQIPTYTEAISLSCGWMFKVPLKDRMGCGYNFDSDLLTFEDAKKEVEEFLGHEIKVIKNINYNVGHFKKCWHKNCIALGLASGFLEPLEASNIGLAQTVLQLMNLEEPNQEYINSEYVRSNDDFVNNIVLRYITNRTDTEFWSDWKQKKLPDQLKEFISSYNETGDFKSFCRKLNRNNYIWYHTFQNLKNPLLNINFYNRKFTPSEENEIKRVMNLINDSVSNYEKCAIPHRDFLDNYL